MKLNMKDLKLFGILFLIGIIENIVVIYGRNLFVNPWVGLVFITVISTLIIKMSGLLGD